MADFFGALLGLLKDWLFWWVDWMISFGLELVLMLLELVMWIVPEGWEGYVAALVPFLEVVNYWVALDLWASVLAMYMTVRALVLTARILIKLVPTIG